MTTPLSRTKNVSEEDSPARKRWKGNDPDDNQSALFFPNGIWHHMAYFFDQDDLLLTLRSVNQNLKQIAEQELERRGIGDDGLGLDLSYFTYQWQLQIEPQPKDEDPFFTMDGLVEACMEKAIKMADDDEDEEEPDQLLLEEIQQQLLEQDEYTGERPFYSLQVKLEPNISVSHALQQTGWKEMMEQALEHNDDEVFIQGAKDLQTEFRQRICSLILSAKKLCWATYCCDYNDYVTSHSKLQIETKSGYRVQVSHLVQPWQKCDGQSASLEVRRGGKLVF